MIDPPDETVGRLVSFAADHCQEMLGLLERMVLIQSGSRNKAGLDRLGRLISEFCQGLGLEVEVHPQEKLGHNLLASTPAAGKGPNQLLIGHMDTVFPQDTAFNWFREDDRKAYGPGVADMKGGLVVGLFALAALKELSRLDRLPIRFIFNSDEEIDSPGSRALIAQEARLARRAFVLECGGSEGQVVTGRKGRLALDLRAGGRAGHAAFAGPDKASAILELAHKVIALEGLNGLTPDLTVNIGTVQGGLGLNTVPEEAWATVDVRYARQNTADLFKESLETILGRTTVAGTIVEAKITSQRPPMEQSRANLDLAAEVMSLSRRLGQEIDHEFRAGGSDANLVAEMGIPVVDGLGPIGGLDHSDREFMIKNSLTQRCALLSLCLLGET